MKFHWVFILGVLGPAIARGDVLILKDAKIENCRVLGIAGESLEYETGNRKLSAPLSTLTSLTVDNQPSFNAGMGFLAQKDYDKARTQFQKCMGASPPPYLAVLCNRFLVEMALSQGEFDQAVLAFVALAKLSPELAGNIPWSFPKANSSYIPQGIAVLEGALKEISEAGAQLTVARVLLQLKKIKGEEVGALEVQIAELERKADPGALADPVKLRIGQIQGDFKAKKYDAVAKAIVEIAPKVFDEKDQGELLMLLAQSREALIPPSADAGAWRSVALDYVRANTPKAMLEAARIHIEKLNEPETGKGIFQRIILENTDGKAAENAREWLGRIGQQGH